MRGELPGCGVALLAAHPAPPGAGQLAFLEALVFAVGFLVALFFAEVCFFAGVCLFAVDFDFAADFFGELFFLAELVAGGFVPLVVVVAVVLVELFVVAS